MSCIISLAKGFLVKAGVRDGVTRRNGKRIVEQLLAKGFSVKAGVLDVDKDNTTFKDYPALQIVSLFYF